MGRPLANDLTGNTYGELFVTGRSSRKAAYPYWVCLCSCTNVVEVASHNLRRGQTPGAHGTRSCGCKTKEFASKSLTGKNMTHGLTAGGKIPPEYEVWRTMLRRCYEESHDSYKNYGAKGIRVCKRWHDFGNFYKDMCPRPSPKLTLERTNGKKGYNPDNCIWATWEVQANNKSNNRFVTYQGRTQTVAQWSRETGIAQAALLRRLDKPDWTIAQALTLPRYARAPG